MPEPTRSCPYCGSPKVRSSRRRTLGERVVYVAGLRAAFRCLSCRKRFFERKHGTLAAYVGLGARTRRDLRWFLPLVAVAILLAIVFWQYHPQGQLRGKRYRLPSTPPTPPALRK